MTLLDDFLRVSKDRPCPICTKVDWCLVKRGHPPASAICARVESPTRWSDAGWFHALERDSRPPRRRLRFLKVNAAPDGRMAAIAEGYACSVMPGRLDRFARSLGVTIASLRRLGIGWTGRCWAFPMVGSDAAICGIRIRKPSGGKFSEKGGHEGIFVPQVLTGVDPLVVCEGPTDTAALLDLGFDAIGRPSCRGGVRLIADFVRRGDWKRHVIFADADGPGLDGALALARVLAPLSHDVRVVVPPAKDARAWKNAGATRENVLDLIGAAPPIRLSVRRAAR